MVLYGTEFDSKTAGSASSSSKILQYTVEERHADEDIFTRQCKKVQEHSEEAEVQVTK